VGTASRGVRHVVKVKREFRPRTLFCRAALSCDRPSCKSGVHDENFTDKRWCAVIQIGRSIWQDGRYSDTIIGYEYEPMRSCMMMKKLCSTCCKRSLESIYMCVPLP
jgi:hypothetical protein